MNVKDNVSRTAASVLVRRPHFTNMFGKVFTASCWVENQELTTRLPEDGTDVHQMALGNVM